MPKQEYRYSFIHRRYLQSKSDGSKTVEEWMFIDFVDKQPLYVLSRNVYEVSMIPEYDLITCLGLMHEAMFRESGMIHTSYKDTLIGQTWDLVAIKGDKIIELREGGNIYE